MSNSNERKYVLEKPEMSSFSEHTSQRQTTENLNAKLANPLVGIPHEQLILDGEAFAKSHGLGSLSELFQKGALVAQDPLGFDDLPQLSDEDKECLRHELTHKWSQPKTLYYLIILCSCMLLFYLTT